MNAVVDALALIGWVLMGIGLLAAIWWARR
jgi:hypothetical protein